MKKELQSITQEESILLYEIQKTKLALESAYSNFENVLDPDLIDCSIYEMNAIQKRHKFLINQLKDLDNKKDKLLQGLS